MSGSEGESSIGSSNRLSEEGSSTLTFSLSFLLLLAIENDSKGDQRRLEKEEKKEKPNLKLRDDLETIKIQRRRLLDL